MPGIILKRKMLGTNKNTVVPVKALPGDGRVPLLWLQEIEDSFKPCQR